MKNTSFNSILCFILITMLPPSSYTQDLQRYLLSHEMYNKNFESINNKDEQYANVLWQYDLQRMVDSNIISTNTMKGFALPLGVHNQEENAKIDFGKGMLDMWNAKMDFIKKDSIQHVSVDMLRLSNKTILNASQKLETIKLQDYRNNILQNAIDSLQKIHKTHVDSFSKERKEFLSLILENLSPNVVLSYNIQELLPPKYFDPIDKIEKPINPLFKIYYFEQLLSQAGLHFLAGIPSRYDPLLCYGPFQITNNALENGINSNVRLFDELKIYKSTLDLKNIEDHAIAALFLAYHNWEALSWRIKNAGGTKLLQKFIDYYKNAEKTKLRNLRILISGMTACMHHSPTKAQNAFISYLQKDQFKSFHYGILQEKAMTYQLRKYFRSSAEIYLVLKVYHIYLQQNLQPKNKSDQ